MLDGNRSGAVWALGIDVLQTGNILARSANKSYFVYIFRRLAMKSQGGISYSNAAVAACPKHLLQFAVDPLKALLFLINAYTSGREIEPNPMGSHSAEMVIQLRSLIH